jgi:sugar phosphate permease
MSNRIEPSPTETASADQDGRAAVAIEASAAPPSGKPAERPTRVRYAVLAWLCAAATIAYICRQSIGVAESTIRWETGLSKAQMGWVMSVFFWSYGVGQIPGGWLGHRYGTRQMLPLLSIAWSIATGVMSVAIGMPLLIGSRIVNGLAQAGLFPAAVNTVSRWFPRSEHALANGALGAFMGVGSAVAAALTGVLLLALDWRMIFLLYSFLGVVWARAFYAWFREWPRDHPAVNAAELELIRAGAYAKHPDEQAEKYEPTPWLDLILSPAMWWISGQHFCRAAGEIFFASWFATYLQEARGVTIAQSGLLTTLPIVARIVGGLAGGVISDSVLRRTGSLRWARQGVAVASLAACAALVFAALGVKSAWLAVNLIALGAFFASLAGPCAYTITIDMGGRHVPTVFSTMNMMGSVGAAAFPPVAALVRVATGSWDIVLVGFGALYIAAAVFWLLLNPNGTIFDQSLLRWGRRTP